ncbi:hypothetical protein WN55_04303 [Dufourea novaeangliae]|uniref:Uncharacterized protein n=1 Tax=Dufourea novaeangliae TaxID=178035 RepID=A0A154PLM7_DUFNO|nr:hypothetical protein WN55_04303 [Dufourea novaeangliae]
MNATVNKGVNCGRQQFRNFRARLKRKKVVLKPAELTGTCEAPLQGRNEMQILLLCVRDSGKLRCCKGKLRTAAIFRSSVETLMRGRY